MDKATKNYALHIFQQYDDIYLFVDNVLINVMAWPTNFRISIYTIEGLIVIDTSDDDSIHSRHNIIYGGANQGFQFDNTWLSTLLNRLFSSLQEQINIPEIYYSYVTYFNMISEK